MKTDKTEIKSLTGAGNGKSNMTYRLVLASILAAISILLMYFETSIPFMPPFLKLDISEIPALFGAFSLGPGAAVLIVLVKNIFHLPTSGTAYVGELANFLAGAAFAGTAGLIFRKMQGRKGAVIAMASGTVAMTIFTSLFNYFFMIDFYAGLFGTTMEQIVAMTAALNSMVSDLRTLVVFAFVPFNIFKGVLVSAITGLLFWRLEPVLRRSRDRLDVRKERS